MELARCVAPSSATSKTLSPKALIAGNISERPAFLEVYLDNNQLFYRPVVKEGEDKVSEGVLLVS